MKISTAKPLLAPALILVAALFFGYILSHVGLGPSLDPRILRSLVQAGNATSYMAHVETEAIFPERVVSINGEYIVDHKEGSYSANSTTTLRFKDIHTPDTFTLQNIVIGNDIYTKLDTDSKRVQKTMPQTNGWKHFTASAIPPAFQNISVPGPVSDNLKIVSDNAQYLTFMVQLPDETVQSRQMHHIVFKLSETVPPEHSMVATLFNRIGKDGTVDAWFDAASLTLMMLRFQGNDYTSTTTITNMNNVKKIIAPISKNE